MTIAFIYILEAHATDEWYVASINEEIPQHRTLRDRYNAATIFLDKYPLHEDIIFLLDNEGNDFNSTYSSWPFRYWLIDSMGLVELKMVPIEDKVSLSDLISWLEAKYAMMLN